MKRFLFFLMTYPVLSFGQVQIGQDLVGTGVGDNFGRAVTISADGSTIASGAIGFLSRGRVCVYENQGGTWVQVGQNIEGEMDSDFSGSGQGISLSADGSIVAIGAFANDGGGDTSGHVRVFENQGGNWVQIGQDIDGEGAEDRSGESVRLSADGSVVAIGGRQNDGNGSNSGHVRVYENQGGNWVQIGQDIDGEAADDESGFGISLSSDGTIVAIGAAHNTGSGTFSGHVRVFENQGGTWVQVGQDIDGESASDQSGEGISLSADGSKIAIGARYNIGNGNNEGHVRVYENQGGTWGQVGQDIHGETPAEHFGNVVGLSSDGTIVAAAAVFNDDNGDDSGQVRLFELRDGSWTQVGDDLNGDAIFDRFGGSLGLSSSGYVLAIGSDGSDINGSSSGLMRVYDFESLLSITEVLSTQDGVLLYPNPSSDVVNIKLNNPEGFEKALLYSLEGRVIQFTKSTTIDISSLASGVYIIEIYSDKGIVSKKLIKSNQ